jgi:cell division inhibitor SepF
MGALRKATAWLGLGELAEGDEDWEDGDPAVSYGQDGEMRGSGSHHHYDGYRYRTRSVDHSGDEVEPDGGPDGAGYQIAMVHPSTFHDARGVGERFRDGVPVIIDLSSMDEADATRVVDFASGLVFGLRGSMERIANRVFLLLPVGVQLSGQ